MSGRLDRHREQGRVHASPWTTGCMGTKKGDGRRDVLQLLRPLFLAFVSDHTALSAISNLSQCSCVLRRGRERLIVIVSLSHTHIHVTCLGGHGILIDSAVLRLHPSSIQAKLTLREDPYPKGGKVFCLLDSRSCVGASFFNLG